MKRISFATLALGTALALPSCTPKPAVIRSPPAIEQKAGIAKKAKNDGHTITVPWAEGKCTVGHGGVVYSRVVSGREQRGAVEFFSPAVIPADHRIVDALPGQRTTAILTNRSIFFTVGWENAFSDKTPSPERPVVQDFFLKSHDVEGVMKKKILGWIANDRLEGFFLESGGTLHMAGAEGGKVLLTFDFNIPFEKKSVLGYHDGDLFIAHPKAYLVAGIANAGKNGRTFTMMLRKPLVDSPSFMVVSGVMVLVNGKEKLPLIRNENGEYGKVLEPIR